MSASARIIAEFRRIPRTIRLLGASGQLGYGIPAASFNAGIERKPDLIGCDMGSIDIGPTYLGKGEMATSPRGHAPRPAPCAACRPIIGCPTGHRHRRIGWRRPASRRHTGDDS
jgi:hypothetical protein